MPTDKKHRERRTIWLRDEDWARLLDAAEQITSERGNETARADVVREAIHAYLTARGL